MTDFSKMTPEQIKATKEFLQAMGVNFPGEAKGEAVGEAEKMFRDLFGSFKNTKNQGDK